MEMISTAKPFIKITVPGSGLSNEILIIFAAQGAEKLREVKSNVWKNALHIPGENSY